MSNSKNLTKLALLVGLVVGASSPAFAVEQRTESQDVPPSQQAEPTFGEKVGTKVDEWGNSLTNEADKLKDKFNRDDKADHRKWDGRGMKDHGKPGGPFADLNLTAEQKDKIGQILKEDRDERMKGFKKAGEVNRELHDLSWSDDYSDDKVKAIVDKYHDEMYDAAIQRAKSDNAIYQVLTPEQREQFKKNRKDPERLLKQ